MGKMTEDDKWGKGKGGGGILGQILVDIICGRSHTAASIACQ